MTVDELPEGRRSIAPLVREPDRLQLFLFSAATWNSHRIHHDPGYAAQEGYPDVLVQSHLHACFLMEAVRSSVGEDGRIVRFGWQNRRFAVPGDRLTCTGTARAVTRDDEGVLVDYELEERNADGDVCVTATATVRFPA
jgi:hydroxyacyl-ACP dehydratase HTD2-like protein with hotdog domain